MALIKCPECGKEISDSAKQCPNCGFPLEEKRHREFPLEGKKQCELPLEEKKQCESTLETNNDTPEQVASVTENSALKSIPKYVKVIILFTLIAAVIVYSVNKNAKEEQNIGTSISPTEPSNTEWEYPVLENLAGAKFYGASITSKEDEAIRLTLAYDPDNYLGITGPALSILGNKAIGIQSSRARIERGIDFKFDDGEVIYLNPCAEGISMDDHAIMIYGRNKYFNRLTNLLKTSKVCKVEITTSEGMFIYTFNVAGLQWTAF